MASTWHSTVSYSPIPLEAEASETPLTLPLGADRIARLAATLPAAGVLTISASALPAISVPTGTVVDVPLTNTEADSELMAYVGGGPKGVISGEVLPQSSGGGGGGTTGCATGVSPNGGASGVPELRIA